MKATRWFWFSVFLLAINAIAVLSSSVWHLALAGEGVPQGPLSHERTQTKPVEPPERTPELDAPAEEKVDQQSLVDPEADQAADSPSDSSRSPASAAPPTTASTPLSGPGDLDLDLAEIPSLATKEELERDPIFQEFQKMFSDGHSSESEPVLESHSQQYFKTLDGRLSAAEQLTSAARTIAAEAARLSREGNQRQAERMLQRTVQLREIAADLLVSEL